MTLVRQRPKDHTAPATVPGKIQRRPQPPYFVKPPPPAKNLVSIGLLIIALLYTLYFAQQIFLPIVGAFIIALLLIPVLRLLDRLRLPSPIGAALIVLGLTGALAYGLYSLAGPINDWRQRIPQIVYELEHKLSVLKAPVEDVKKASQQVERIARLGAGEEQPKEIVVESKSMLGSIFDNFRIIIINISITVVYIYFILSFGDVFKERFVRMMPSLKDKRRAILIARQVEQQVSTYMLAITLINITLGVAIGLALHAIGLPNAPLWGVMAAGLNYIPYLGALVGAVIVGIVGLLTFGNPAEALLPPAIYIGINILESQFITPNVLGRSFTLNPLVIFGAVVFWGWMWGIPGALLAVPLLVIIKAFCDHVEPLAGIGEFIKGRES